MFSNPLNEKAVLGLTCHHLAPTKQEYPVFPLFIPFAGCPYRCIYCAQQEQTGQKETQLSIILHKALIDLRHFVKTHPKPFDLAFFGGTFTSLPLQDAQQIALFIESARQFAPLLRLRCSTRPDAITPAIIKNLQALGMQTIELGIQSFSNKTLHISKRGYTEHIATYACQLIKESGFTLGIQLMPGMPGQTREEAQRDITITTALQPDFVRLYPCLVIAKTKLAELWREKEFTLWSDEDMIDFLSTSCLNLWQNNIKVIRIGVAHEKDFENLVLAGTRHQALGTMVRGQALFLWIQEKIRILQDLQIIPKENTCEASKTLAIQTANSLATGKTTDTTSINKLYAQLQEHKLYPAAILPNTALTTIEPNHVAKGDEKSTPFIMYVPQQYSGEFWGHKKELQQKYKTASFPLVQNQIVFWQAPFFSFVVPT